MYQARYLIAGYFVGKAVSTQVSLCRVVGGSMLPTLDPTGDILLLTSMREGTLPEVGGVYVMWHPSRQYKVIKRVCTPREDKDGQVISVAKGYVWVEGDNKRLSDDSQNYGALPIVSILGRAQYIVWPPARIGTVD